MKRLVSAVVVLSIALVVLVGSLTAPDAKSKTYTAPSVQAITPAPVKPPVLLPSDIDTNQLNTLVNQDRANVGEAALHLNPQLNASSMAKCDDMVARNYWSHDAPDGTTPWQFMTAQGVPYIHLGENLAAGFGSAQFVNSSWMNSTEHRRNILDPQFTDVGYAVCKSDKFAPIRNVPTLIVVQHFAEL